MVDAPLDIYTAISVLSVHEVNKAIAILEADHSPTNQAIAQLFKGTVVYMQENELSKAVIQGKINRLRFQNMNLYNAGNDLLAQVRSLNE